MPSHAVWLLVSSSARCLAQSAVRAGIAPVVLDLYADEDTQEIAARHARVLPGVAGFDANSLLFEAERLAPGGSDCALVYGSGFEGDEVLLEKLSRGRTLYGNSPDVLRLLKNPPQFFDLLDTLGIRYPAVCFDLPADLTDWLLKPAGGTGGRGIRPATPYHLQSAHYYQRRLQGPAFSALFLADGRNARIIGFNTLWTASHDSHEPFLFAGGINRTSLSARQHDEVQDYLDRLIQSVPLKGLNSLDFMLDADQVQVLEINPRPSATQTLYDADFPAGILALHVAACQGQLPRLESSLQGQGPVRAFKVLFSAGPFTFPLMSNWPEGCADRPAAGTQIGLGQPICTLTAEGAVVQDVLASIKMREQQLLQHFNLPGA